MTGRRDREGETAAADAVMQSAGESGGHELAGGQIAGVPIVEVEVTSTAWAKGGGGDRDSERGAIRCFRLLVVRCFLRGGGAAFDRER